MENFNARASKLGFHIGDICFGIIDKNPKGDIKEFEEDENGLRAIIRINEGTSNWDDVSYRIEYFPEIMTIINFMEFTKTVC